MPISFGSGFDSGFDSGFGGSTLEVAVELDIDGDGSYSYNLIADARSFECRHGEDNATMVIGRASAGVASVLLNNFNGQYSPYEASSPLFGILHPGMGFRIRSVAPWGEALFTGILDSLPKPSVSPLSLPTAQLSAAGVLTNLVGDNNKVSPPIMRNAYTGEIIEAILDEAGWPSNKRIIDRGDVPVTYWFVQDKEALSAVREMEDTEQGFLYEDELGNIVFESRYHRDFATASMVSQATFSDVIDAPLSYTQIGEEDPLRELFNVVTETVQPFHLHESQTLWELENETLVFAAGETKEFFAVAEGDTADEAAEPIAAVDRWTSFEFNPDDTGPASFLLNPDEETEQELFGDWRISVTPFGQSALVSITNIDSVTHFTSSIALGGVPVAQHNAFRIMRQDETSKARHGRRTFPNTSPWFANAAYAEGTAEFILSRTKDPHPIIGIKVMADTVARAEQVFTRRISDRITLTASNRTKVGIIAQDFYIENRSFGYTAKQVPYVIWELSPAFENPGYWQLEVSDDLGSDTILAY